MSEFPLTLSGPLYLVYGLSFFVLGIVALVLSRRDTTLPFACSCAWLAAFGLLHGTLEFVEMGRLVFGHDYHAPLVGTLALASYLPLLEFGRRTLLRLPAPVRIPPFPLYALVAASIATFIASADAPLVSLKVAAHLFVGVPAALLTAFALFAQARTQSADDNSPPLRRSLTALAVIFLAYGLVTPFTTAGDAGFPAWLPTSQHFAAATGIPVELLHTLLAVAATLTLIALARSAGEHVQRELERTLHTIRGFVYRCRNNPQWSMQYLSGNVEELLGYPRAAFFGDSSVSFGALMHPEDAPHVRENVQRALAERRDFELSYRMRTRNGEWRHMQERGRGVFTPRGELRYLEGYVADATALEESMRRLAQTQAMASLGSWEWDIATDKLSWSDEIFRIYGLDPSVDTPSYERFVQAIHPQDREATLALLRRALECGAPYETEFRIVRPDGGTRIVAARGEVSRSPEGRPLKMFGMGQDVTVRAELSARLAKIGRHAPGMIFQFLLRPDGSTAFPYASEGIRGIYGVAPEDVTDDAAITFARKHAEDLPGLMESIQNSARTLTDWHYQYRVNHPTKGEIWVEGRASPERLPDGGTLWHGALFDATAQKRAELALAQSLDDLRASETRQRELAELAQREQGRMATLLSGMSIGILFEDRDNRVEYVNPAFRNMWAITEGVDLVGRATRDVLDHSTHRFARPDHASKHILQVLDTHEISERFEIDLYDGRILTQLSYPVSDGDGRAIGRLWVYEDITHERQTAQQLIYLAEHDALTGLYNRHRFQEHLERMISSSARSGARFALLYFDLDDFKTINDTFGHRAGDTVLVRAAGEVASMVRGGELFARLGGDEFAILVDMPRGNEPEQLAERIVHAISAIPFRFRGSNLRLTASVGIAHFPEHGSNAEDLVAHADTAMYQAKDSGKNTWALYDASRNVAEAMLEHMTWSSRIAHALAHDGLELHFQGIYRTGDGSLSHLEALVRMKDPAQPDRIVMPGQFIPVAEKNGQILEIDRWVIHQSLATLAAHPELPALAVNVSGRSFDQPGLPHYIQQQLAHFCVEPRRLIIELTETAAVSEMQDAQRFIEALQQTGCPICLDDFGSGFSTFAYLKYLDAQILKIDGMFIRDLPNNRDNQAFVKAMIDVARGLNKITVAEFVEDAATLDMLASLGVDLAQGYHLHRPSAQLPIIK